MYFIFVSSTWTIQATTINVNILVLRSNAIQLKSQQKGYKLETHSNSSEKLYLTYKILIQNLKKFKYKVTDHFNHMIWIAKKRNFHLFYAFKFHMSINIIVPRFSSIIIYGQKQ